MSVYIEKPEQLEALVEHLQREKADDLVPLRISEVKSGGLRGSLIVTHKSGSSRYIEPNGHSY